MKKAFRSYAILLVRFLSSGLVKLYTRNTYDSIDELPIFYWMKIQESSNLSYLVRSKSTHLFKKEPVGFKKYALSFAWRKILDEYIAKFGFNESFLDIIRKEDELASHRLNKIITGDRTLNAFINICESELNELKSESTGGNFYQLKGLLDIAGFNIDPMRTSVTEFYTHLKTLQDKGTKKVAVNEE